MPYTLKTQQISVKDPDSGEYIGVDVLTEQTKEGLIAELQDEGNTQVARINQAAVDVQSAVDQAETEVQQLISNTQSSLNTFETQKDTIAQTIASMAELGTDTTLTTAGMAADAKATGDEFSNVKNAISDKVLKVAPGKNLYNPALNQSGRIYTNAIGQKQTTTTSTTQVYQKMIVEVGQAYAISAISKCSITDENDLVIDYPTVSNTNCIIQSIPSGVKYLWIETNATLATTVTQVEKGTSVTSYEPFNADENVVYGNTVIFKTDDVSNIKADIVVDNAVKPELGFNPDTVISGYVNSSGGFVAATSGWERTDFIETIPGAACKASLRGYLTNPIVAFYDADKVYMPDESIKSNSQLVVDVNTVVPSGAKYVIFVSQTTYAGANFEIEVPATIGEAVEDLIDEKTPYKGVKVLCLGDSLTAGRDGSGNILQHNYPYYMQGSRLKGCTILNYGVAGSTSKTYWDSHINNVPFDETIDVILCMWGTNGGLVSTTALATDVEPYDNYEDYADTGVGCYCKIIEYAMEQTQNNAQIILLTPPYNGDTSINSRVINAQPVVKQIAERYNLPVIDMFKCGIGKFNYTRFMPVDSVHFSEEGYEWIGKYIGGCADFVCSKID